MSTALKNQPPLLQSSDPFSPSTPLMATTTNPPLSSPSPSPEASDEVDGIYKLPLTTPLRLLAALLSLISSLLQLSAGPDADEVFGVVVNIASWLAVAWNLLAAFPPRVSLAVVVGGGGGGGGGGGRGETVILGARGEKKRRQGATAALVDVALALALLVLEVLLFLLPFPVYYWWASTRNCYGIVGLNGVVAVLMLGIALLELFPRRGPVYFVVRPAVYGDRIQLP
ncbi:hypothetical protein F4775DRAFT_421287 [Biscogniauxia sp. FL1348]|nr:hypothetical protein F4775DRAFT_421287 [Biscogniauxia sp. FL1348]